jgi:hypothetical protein
MYQAFSLRVPKQRYCLPVSRTLLNSKLGTVLAGSCCWNGCALVYNWKKNSVAASNKVLQSSILYVQRREVIYCKRAILSLSSSKILTPPPIPLSARRVCNVIVYPPVLGGRGKDTLARGRGGWGSIFWKTREIGLPSYINLSTNWWDQGVTERCRLSWLTNCALVNEPKLRGEGFYSILF